MWLPEKDELLSQQGGEQEQLVLGVSRGSISPLCHILTHSNSSGVPNGSEKLSSMVKIS